MGVLGTADKNTPLKSKARRWLKKQPQHAHMPSTPIASSESPVQPVGQSPESPSLVGTALRSFEKDGKLGITFQDTGGQLALKVIGFTAQSQGLEQGVKVSARRATSIVRSLQVLIAVDVAHADGLGGVGGQRSDVGRYELQAVDGARS